jgi:two-component system sensor histidine kinase VicK
MSDQFRLSRIHLVVGALSCLAVVIALIAIHDVARLQRNTTAHVRDNLERVRRYDDLLVAANALREPLIDAFGGAPLDARGELRQRDDALRRQIDALRRDVRSHVALGTARQASLAQLDLVDAHRAIIVGEGEQLLRALAAGQVRAAGARLRNVDAAGAAILQAQIDVRAKIRELQFSGLRANVAERMRVERNEWMLLALLVLLIIGQGVYVYRAFVEKLRAQMAAQQMGDLERRNAALQEALEGIATFNKEGKFTWTNARFADILGYASNELVGVDITASLVGTDPDRVAAAEAELRQSGRTDRQFKVRRKDGAVADVQAVLVFRKEIGGGFAFLKDITSQKSAEEALRLSDERFRMAMAATHDIVSDWDFVNNKIWVNDNWYTGFGFPESAKPEIDTVLLNVHPDDRTRAMALLHETLASGRDVVTDELRCRRHDGTYIHMFVRAKISRDAQGRPLRMVNSLTDVTSYREMVERLERLSVLNRMILASAADGLYGVDRDGRTTFVNRAAIEMLGWTEEDLAGKNLHSIVHGIDTDGKPIPWSDCSIFQALASGGPSSSTATYWTKNGAPLDVEFTTRPMHDAHGAIAGAVVTFRDITERLAVERMKDEFVSVVSHELRTPLTSIRGALGLIAAGLTGTVPARMDRMLRIAVSNTDRLVRLINDILDLERIDSGKITLSRDFCSAAELIGEAVDSMKPLAAQSGVRLEQGAAEGMLFADRDRILQTLTNLIGNAIKFSPPQTAVTVAAAMVEGAVEFCVADHGRGVPKEKLEAIFERFQQVDASDAREKGGSGLGLAICHSIVQQHGGEIWVQSKESEGSRFFFTIPSRDLATARSTANDVTSVAAI